MIDYNNIEELRAAEYQHKMQDIARRKEILAQAEYGARHPLLNTIKNTEQAFENGFKAITLQDLDKLPVEQPKRIPAPRMPAAQAAQIYLDADGNPFELIRNAPEFPPYKSAREIMIGDLDNWF
jgi:hypothetical protein